MTARTHHRPTHRTAAWGVRTRLPWWALALPAAAFTALLFLPVGGNGTAGTNQPVTAVLEILWTPWLS